MTCRNALNAGHTSSRLAIAWKALCRHFRQESAAISVPVQIMTPRPAPDGERPTPAQLAPWTARAERWAKVRHLDENSEKRRRVQEENEVALMAELRQMMGKGR